MSEIKDIGQEDELVEAEEPKNLTRQKGMVAMQGIGDTSDEVPVSPDLPIADLENHSPSEWKDLGIVNVPVCDLPNPEGVNSPDDFNHHISWNDAKSATQQLPQIQQAVANGKTGDNFAAEDATAGLDWQNGKKRVYDLYYSKTDPVQLDKNGDQYVINSGRHRIFAAKELGVESIPARVHEKQG